MRRLPTPAFVVLVLVAVFALLSLAVLGGSPAASPAPVGLATPGSTPGASGSPTGSPPGLDGSASASPAAGSGEPSSAPPSAPPGPVAGVPIVPVVDFRSTITGIDASDVKGILAGTDPHWNRLELVKADADGILAALGAPRPTSSAHFTTAASAAVLAKDLAADSSRLAFLRASQVTPAVRAVAWSGKSLFGVDRITKTASWPLVARLPGDARPFNAGSTWTLVAGGDIMLDRGVYREVHILGKGVDFPFNGGTADITGHRCCSALGWPTVIARRTGNAGAVRHLLSRANIAVANFENPAPDDYHYHTQGTVFSADPRLIAGVKDAGIDVVSIANNHIGDAGTKGVLQTIANLDARGIRHAGAGKNTAAAHRPAMLQVGGVMVAILAYDTIAKRYAAGPSKPGSAQLTAAGVKADVAAARAAGADVVIVYPHWGTEYKAAPFPAQQRLARAVIDAGADMVIGNHAHWVGAMEVYKGKPIWYALGNFVFDQDWSEPTSEGMLLELTFSGKSLVQVVLHPTVILDKSQPNFLDPAGDGRVVLGQLYDASKKLLPW
ncbi:MAG: CapA family protein [Candidatus Limnocylindrales bacterium]